MYIKYVNFVLRVTGNVFCIYVVHVCMFLYIRFY